MSQPDLSLPTEPKDADTPKGTQLLDKAFGLIELIERSNLRLTAQAIAQASGHAKPTVYRILSALVRRGFLAFDRRDQTYALGLRFTELAASFRGSHRLVMLIEDDLIALSERTGETLSIAIAEPDAVRLVGRYNLGLEPSGGDTGAKRPYHASALGKAILAWSDEAPRRAYLSRTNFQLFTPHTLSTAELLLADLQLARARGFAFDDEEIVSGVRCIALPLLTARGELVGAVSLSAPANRLPTERVNEIAAVLNIIAGKVSARWNGTLQGSPQLPDGFICLRRGGLFKPLAMGAFADRIMIVDGAAPSLLTFHKDGALLHSRRLPIIPDCAAIGPDGTKLLSADNHVGVWNEDKLDSGVKLGSRVTALAFGADGRAYSATGSSMHDAFTGRRLFALDRSAQAMAVTAKTILLLENSHVAIRERTSGELQARYPCTVALGRLATIATDGNRAWLSGRDCGTVEEMDLHTGAVRHLAAPERSLTALAVADGQLYLAGCNVHASLAGEGDGCCGSLYRRGPG